MSSTYRTTCNQCGGSNNVVWNNDGHSYCYNCGAYQGKSTAEVKIVKRSPHIKLIREFYAELSEAYHKNLRDEHYIWLFKRGISEHSIKTLKIGYCGDGYIPLYASKIVTESGIYYNSHITHKGRIVFPFISEYGVTDIWSRSITADDTVKYKGCFSPAFRRGSDYMYMHDACYKPDAHKRIVHTEGIIKAVIANQYGIPCIATPGTLSNRPGTTPLAGQEQIICFDNQIDHRRELITAIKKRAEQYINPKIATLPLRGNSKADIDQYILQFGIDDYRRVVESALEYDVWKQLVR